MLLALLQPAGHQHLQQSSLPVPNRRTMPVQTGSRAYQTKQCRGNGVDEYVRCAGYALSTTKRRRLHNTAIKNFVYKK